MSLRRTEQLARARAAADTIAGWMTPGEAELLFGFAASAAGGSTIVEIGSWKGKSTALLAMGAMLSEGIRVFAIDPHLPYLDDPHGSLEEFRTNMGRFGLTGVVTSIVEQSSTAAVSFDRPVDVLFIDGDHSEAGVTADIAGWLPKVAEGGTVAFHDVRNLQCPGVSRALGRALWSSTQVADVHLRDSILWLTRVGRASMKQRLRNKTCAVLLRLYSGLSRLPGPVVTAARNLLVRAG